MLTLGDGSIRKGQVLEVRGQKAIVQVSDTTSALNLPVKNRELIRTFICLVYIGVRRYLWYRRA